MKEICPSPPTWEDINHERVQCNNEKDILEKYAGHRSEAAVRNYLSRVRERELGDYELLDGIKEALTLANQKGVIQLVVGFRDPETTKEVLKRLGIAQYLHVIPTETVGRRLPDVRVWNELIVPHFPEIEKKESKKVWFAKESAEMIAANKANIPFCWLKNVQGDAGRIFDLEPTKTIGDIRSQILPMFKHFLELDITEEDKLSMQKEEEREAVSESVSPTLR